MPSINMKLEMVTLIACDVDTEVFTSDKMQVLFQIKLHVLLSWLLFFWVSTATT